MNELNWFGKLLLVVPITFISIVMILAYCNEYVEPFLRKRKMIKMELSRANVSSRGYWKRKLLKNYLRLIPIVGSFMKKRKRSSHFKHSRPPKRYK